VTVGALVHEVTLENVNNTIMDPVLLILCHALGYPHDVADFLLAEAHVGEKDAVVELLLKRIRAALDLLLIQNLK
jgi:hypothetical protein